jgi:parvulin-like peptidyl-prolyl isomerase
LFCLALAACGEPVEQEPPALARVGDQQITAAELQRFEERVADPERPVPARTNLQTLVDRELLLREARERSLHEDEEVLRDLAADEESELAQRMLAQIVGPATVTDEEVQRAYRQPGWDEQVRAVEIYVSTESQAGAVLDRLRRGADILDVAREHTVDPLFGVPTGEPRQMVYHAYDHPRAVVESLFALPVGGVSEPIPVQSGFLIAAVLARERVELPRLSEGIHEALLAEKRQQLRNSYLRHLKWDFGTQYSPEGMALVIDILRGEASPPDEQQGRQPVYEFNDFDMTVADVLGAVDRPRWSGVTDDDINQLLSEDYFPTLLMARDARRKGAAESPVFVAWREARLGDHMLRRLRQDLLAEVEISEEDLQQVYEASKQRYRSAAWVRLQEILVEDPEEASRLAEQAKGGTPLSDLLEHSVRGAEDGLLEVSTSHTPAYGETWMNAVMNAPLGEVRGPVRTTGGYSIFVKREHHPERFHTLESERVRSSVMRQAREREEARQFGAFLDSLRQVHADLVEVNEEAVERYARRRAEGLDGSG